MSRTPRPLVVSVVAVGLAALAIGACGSSSKNTSSASAPTTTNGPAATVAVAKTNLGNVLVDTNGRTLYLFRKDVGTTSECTGSCATFWPPLTVTGTPTAGTGAKASLVGTTTRSGGKTQVTYNGHPVYLYSGDHGAGDTNGEGINAFGATWYVLSASGNQITGSASSSGSGGTGY